MPKDHPKDHKEQKHATVAVTPPSERPTLASSVYEKLRHDIICGHLTPGEKLRVEFLRERYKVGNSPVREALNRLSAEYLVRKEEQRGFRVAEVSLKELEELTKARCWLEELALRESIRNGDTSWEENLVLSFHRLSRMSKPAGGGPFKRTPEWEECHDAFHLALIAACGSQWLLSFCEQLWQQAKRYRHLAAQKAYREIDKLAEHQAIFDAAIERDADRAVDLLLAHYRKTLDIVRDSDEAMA